MARCKARAAGFEGAYASIEGKKAFWAWAANARCGNKPKTKK